MSEENIRFCKDLRLINRRVDAHMLRQRAKSLDLNRFPAGDHNIHWFLPQRVDTFLIKIRSLIDDRTQRDVHQRPVVFLIRRRLAED